MRKISLKAKIVTIVLLVFFGVAPATSYFVIGYFKDRLQESIQNQQVILVSRTASELDFKISSAQRMLVSVALSIPEQVVRDPRAAERFLYERSFLSMYFDSGTFLLNPRGQLIAETAWKPSRVGRDFSFREYFKDTLATGKPVISAPYVPRTLHHPVVMFTAPVFGAGGKLIAILAGSTDLYKDNLLGDLSTARIGSLGYFSLYDHEGVVIMHPVRERIFSTADKQADHMKERIAQARAGVNVQGELEQRDGSRTLSTMKKLGSIDWVLAASYPVEEAYAPVQRLVRLSWWIMGCGGVFAALLMWMTMSHLITPLLSLTRQIRQLGESNGDQPMVQVESNDEIRETAEAINGLLERLRLKEIEKETIQKDAMQTWHLASLGEVAAGVAHEINNPINGIINCAQILAAEPCLSEPERGVANRIIKEGERVAVIVRSLLSFARYEGRERVPAYVHDILNDTLELTRVQLKRDGVQLHVELPPDLPALLVHPHQIEQVFLNLISNARYALDKKFSTGAGGGKRLDIKGEKIIGDDGVFVRIEFRDNGTGIPRDVIGRVIDPFFTTKPATEGTGLGLSISHGLISDHGGRLRVESVEGEFTRVQIDLPVMTWEDEYGQKGSDSRG
ncbi:sensor histidine kinase [Geobacter sulfurreducens]|uniref:sensor histidine kinase n=1 Tax=Geobacter sulfurreducens TaxID=35554 RepID=UPI000DBB440D|nr:cache domain-containing protein [Geobacter sulfurreducens]BBA70938.1 Sporulation kinase E [Geobacter sulfurreducens]